MIAHCQIFIYIPKIYPIYEIGQGNEIKKNGYYPIRKFHGGMI